ncbi:sulfotransferase family protein [Acrocarpospora pleiomorpha]|uniref:Sulfotransferase family protein n=1 Tax=Acrocarpospora pleiomorpha TaxID=90975 RepID=A0A5M3XYT6_9ACTN|nr:sulfotransferase family protein [Acrocarpospora pleiomorpha]GES25109.1 sulfotransferase family protein [Acrocarpospora pleiomorpha]
MVEIIGAGMGRTGTYSLQAALVRLGYGPCHHMSSLGEHPGSIPRWEAVVRGEEVDWKDLLAGYRSAVDWPVCSFWRDLADTYSDAKVVLTVRDPESWYASARETIYRYMAKQPGIEGVIMRLEERLYPSLRRRRALCERLIWKDTFESRFDEPEFAMEIFQRHNKAVQRAIAPDRLLVFDVRQGWQPLCDFLDVEIPDEPFPHLNIADSFVRTAALRRRRALTLRRMRPEEGSAIR